MIMKRHVQRVGVRNWAGDDLVDLQREPLAVLDAFFAEYGPCVIQGCGITARPDDSGTFDVAPGLVALETDDPDGTRRVMTMPFPGATGVALPLYLTASVETLTDVYGDGKVKPIAYAYTATAVGTDPGAEVPHLTLTADGGNRFVDAVQDPAHRFISDTERARWNGILAQAKAYADSVSATGSEAALRSAKEYTDARETAILIAADTKDADTLKTAKAYADKIVAALAGSAPETLDTLQELAAALGDDPNFSATVMQMIGERVTAAALAEALEGKQNTTVRLPDGVDLNTLQITGTYDTITAVNAPVTDPIYISVIRHTGSGNWVSQTVVTLGDSANSPSRIFHRCGVQAHDWTPWVEVWHSGNFDPDKVRKGKTGSFPSDSIISWNDDLLCHSAVYRVDGWRSDGNHGAGIYDKVGAPPMLHPSGQGILIIDEAGGYTYEVVQRMVFANGLECVRIFYNSVWSEWRTVYNSGNFDAQNALKYLGRGTLLDKWGNGYGFTQGDTPIDQHSSSYLSFGMSGYEVEICLGGYSSWLNGWNRIFFRSRNADDYSVSDWKEFWHSGNLGLATASADGLMAAADKRKLDGITTGGMKLLGAGVVEAEGSLKNKTGLITSLTKPRIGLYRIYHNIGNTNYEVMATGIVSNNNRGYPVLAAKTSGYFDIRTADDASDNDAGFFFQVFEF